MKLEPQKYPLDKESIRKGRLAIGLITAIFAISNFWSVLQHGQLYWHSARWDWLDRLLTNLFGPFGSPAAFFICSLTLIIPSLRKPSDRTKGK